MKDEGGRMKNQERSTPFSRRGSTSRRPALENTAAGTQSVSPRLNEPPAVRSATSPTSSRSFAAHAGCIAARPAFFRELSAPCSATSGGGTLTRSGRRPVRHAGSRAPLAQSAEHLTLNQRVEGSIPSGSTSFLVFSGSTCTHDAAVLTPVLTSGIAGNTRRRAVAAFLARSA